MDKKIILSVLIVALIGIVAATYQINTGEDILNPLASVETEESPITDVLTAPQTEEDAQAQAEAQAQADAQAEAQAQAEADAQAEAEGQADSGVNPDNQGQDITTGSTSKSASIIGTGDTLVVSTGEGSGSNNGGSGNSNPSNNPQVGSVNPEPEPEPISDEIKTAIQSIIQPKIDSEHLSLDMDSCKYENNSYKVDAYDQDKVYAGTFFVDIDNDSWYFLDRFHNYISDETPSPDDPNLGIEDTDDL